MSSADRSTLPSTNHLYPPPLKVHRRSKRRASPNPRCSFFRCVKGLLSAKVVYERLDKQDKDHLRRTHSKTPVEISDSATGFTFIHTRNPDLEMRFQCYCGSKMLTRDSVVRHHPCAKLKGAITGNKYFSIVSSELEPPDVKVESQSEGVCEDEEEDEMNEVQNNSGSAYSPMNPWQQDQSFRGAASDITLQQTSFIFNELRYQQSLTFQQQKMLQDQQRQQDELVRQMKELQERIVHLEQEREEHNQLRSVEQLYSGAQVRPATTIAHSSYRLGPSNTETRTITNSHPSTSTS
ncbi:hypothetical protein BGZ47_001562, partial [Haplosporangium gracile]